MFDDVISSAKSCHTYKCFDIEPVPDKLHPGYDIYLFEEYVGWEATVEKAKQRIREFQAGSYHRISNYFKFYEWEIDKYENSL